jgi:RHS repeat-associated protein
VLELEQNLGPGTVTTTYAYDAANQLNTAQQGSTSWQYMYDENGSLVSDGIKTYTYDSANRLTQVSDQTIVTNLSYNGLGQRLSMDAAGVIAHYVMDTSTSLSASSDQPLTADSAGNTTFYLYGLGAIGEKTDAWSYSLPDGTNTPRQLSNLTGEVTLSTRYTPWGDTLDTYGTGNFAFGYLGGVMDAATGLLYVGNGQYYDPETGRFLTRDAKPNSSNPYVPWDPTGAILGPLGIAALFFAKRKKGSKSGTLLVLLLVVMTVSMTLSACGPQPTPAPQPTEVPSDKKPPTDPSPNPSQTPEPAPSETSTPTAPPSPTNTPLIDGDCGIPPAIYTYPCTASGNRSCVSPADDAVVQIAHTIIGEGGSFGDFVAANILQTVVNRAYTYWVFTHQAGINPNNIPWNQINREKLQNLFLFILSEPGGEGWPSYNAWRAPISHSGDQWEHVVEAVEALLNNAGTPPSSAVKVHEKSPASEISSDSNVQWYGATTDPQWQPQNVRWVHQDTITRYTDGREIFCQRQFYTLGVIRPPFEPGKNCP